MIAFKTKRIKDISRYIYGNWNNGSPEAFQIFTNNDFYIFSMRGLNDAIYHYLKHHSVNDRVWFELRHPAKPMSVYIIIEYDREKKEYQFEYTYNYDRDYMPYSHELTFISMNGMLV